MPVAFTHVDVQVPGAESTELCQINDVGEVIGTFRIGDTLHGFLMANGRIVKLDELSGRPSTIPIGLNNRGEIVGTMGTGTAPDGFLYRNGRFEVLRGPAGQATVPRGINDLEIVVGNFPGAPPFHIGLDVDDNPGPAFAEIGGRFVDIDRPGTLATVPYDVNDLGVIVGAATTDGFYYHGFQNSYGRFADVATPGSFETLPFSINILGEIGGENDGPFIFPTGFVRIGAAYTTTVPFDDAFSEVRGVNDLGQLAGTHLIADPTTGTLSIEVGFIATPVTSASR